MNQPMMEVSPDGQQVRFSKICEVTSRPYEVTISMDQFNRWRQGAMIQNVCPELNADQREFLISKLTPAEWDALMGPEED